MPYLEAHSIVIKSGLEEDRNLIRHKPQDKHYISNYYGTKPLYVLKICLFFA